jgi:hypothetical protein
MLAIPSPQLFFQTTKSLLDTQRQCLLGSGARPLLEWAKWCGVALTKVSDCTPCLLVVVYGLGTEPLSNAAGTANAANLFVGDFTPICIHQLVVVLPPFLPPIPLRRFLLLLAVFRPLAVLYVLCSRRLRLEWPSCITHAAGSARGEAVSEAENGPGLRAIGGGLGRRARGGTAAMQGAGKRSNLRAR